MVVAMTTHGVSVVVFRVWTPQMRYCWTPQMRNCWTPQMRNSWTPQMRTCRTPNPKTCAHFVIAGHPKCVAPYSRMATYIFIIQHIVCC